MSSWSRQNATAGDGGLLQRLLLFSVTTVPCGAFLFINGVMLATLRGKRAFQETSRYVLLSNLLLADTAQLALSQLLYVLAATRLTLSLPACGGLVLLASLTSVISPLTLVVMAVERYVAVCFPLRHAAVVTGRNTAAAVLLIWAAGSLNVAARVLVWLQFPFPGPGSLPARMHCSTVALLSHSRAAFYDSVCMYAVFVSAGATLVFSYFGVMAAAHSASTDRQSARKAHHTLLLHLVQLGLSLLSTIHNPLLVAVSQAVSRTVMIRVQNVLYVFIIQAPRCLSALIYGLRDRNIRQVLTVRLCGPI